MYTGKALCSENQYYFFTEVKENRSTENGYWKEIGVTEPILSTSVDQKVGIKKYLVFHIGETETCWVMQEYHICSSGFDTNIASYQNWSKWVLCRVYEKDGSQQGLNCYDDDDDSGTELSCLDEVFLSSLDDDVEEISMPEYGY